MMKLKMTSFERPNIRNMEGYAPGEQLSAHNIIKLNTNESPFPPTKRVGELLANFNYEALNLYPDPSSSSLRKFIAEMHGLTPSNIVITHGGDEGLRLAVTTFVDPGEHCLFEDPTYSLYSVLAGIQDAKSLSIELNDDWSLPEDFANRAIKSESKLTFIVNPHAPSGRFLTDKALGAIADSIPGVLLIDEAYFDFVDTELKYNTAEIVKNHKNVLVLRTLSKGYGLAGLRLAYLVGDEKLVAPIREKTADSYNTSKLNQELGLVALQDQDYADNVWNEIRIERSRLSEELRMLGFKVNPSQTNFILVESPEPKINAKEIYNGLRESGVLVRYFDTKRLKRAFRVTVGTRSQNAIFLEKLSVIS